MRKVAFVGGNVFDSASETFVPVNVICEGGFITDITEDDVPYGYEIEDIVGKYLIPGFIDVHTHGIGGYDFNYAKENEIPFMCSKYAREGTTSLMATLASDTVAHMMNSIFAVNQNRINTDSSGANILGIHIEGRYLNPEMKGCHAEDLLSLPKVEEMSEFALAMMPPPLHFSIAPELEGADKFIRSASELGATIGIAHTNATYEQAKRAIRMGARSFTHTFNAMTKIHHRNPGASVCALTCDDAFAEIICDGYHVHPSMIQLAYKSKPKDKLVLITDSMAGTASGDGEYILGGKQVTVSSGRAFDSDGNISGSTLTMFNAVKNLMRFCNIPFTKAIKYATVNPAQMVGADFVGKILKCYRADFITVSNTENPEIENVYVSAQKIR